ncbi:MAG: hypothetical protein M3384_15140 [Acidobacteriota bacterium]|nr:hypothetical protein [Acidobacteriota bacterium]
MKITSIFLCLCLLTVSVQHAFAQTDTSFKIDTLVSNGKKSKEENSTLSFSQASFKSSYQKTGAVIKEFNYADIKAADYSYSKKPLLSTGGAVAMAIFTGLIVVPFLFMKKKQHWLSVRTENDYVVMRLDNGNFRQVLNEFEIRKVEVKNIDEDATESREKKKAD